MWLSSLLQPIIRGDRECDLDLGKATIALVGIKGVPSSIDTSPSSGSSRWWFSGEVFWWSR